jgi:PAS domain S-box-containing protein
VPAIQLTRGWSLKPQNPPTIAHYLLAIALGVIGLFVGLQLNHPLLPCVAAVFSASYVGGLGAGLLASATLFPGVLVSVHDVRPSHDLVEIAIACSILAWAVSRFRQLELTRDAISKDLDAARRTLDRIPVGTWTASANGSIFSVNQWLLDYTGLERGFFEDKSGAFAERQKRQEHLNPDDPDRMAKRWYEVMGSESTFEDEFRMRKSDGVFHWFKSVGESMRDETGKNVAWYGALVCIDKQKEVEDELRRAEHDLRLIVETIPAFVWCAGPSGENLYVNQRLLNYSGATAEDFAGEGWAAFLHPDDVAQTNVAWQKALETGGPYEWSYRMRRADGVYEWFLVLAQVLRDESGAPLRWYGIDFNIDAQKQAEATLGETQARLSRSAQFATVAEFAAAIAHEVTQPLFGAKYECRGVSIMAFCRPTEHRSGQGGCPDCHRRWKRRRQSHPKSQGAFPQVRTVERADGHSSCDWRSHPSDARRTHTKSHLRRGKWGRANSPGLRRPPPDSAGDVESHSQCCRGDGGTGIE